MLFCVAAMCCVLGTSCGSSPSQGQQKTPTQSVDVAVWSETFCTGFEEVRSLIDAVSTSGSAGGPADGLISPVPNITTASALKTEIVSRLGEIVAVAKHDAATMDALGYPRRRGGSSIAHAFIQSVTDLQREFQGYRKQARSLPTDSVVTFVRERDALATEVTHRHAGNSDLRHAYALDKANGRAFHDAFAKISACGDQFFGD
jgi:hypothetical protein